LEVLSRSTVDRACSRKRERKPLILLLCPRAGQRNAMSATWAMLDSLAGCRHKARGKAPCRNACKTLS
jgi:hypothetical protein